MMTHIYIFSNTSRAASYGIGTYIRLLSDCMSLLSDTMVNIVELNANVKEFTVSEENGKKRYLRFPVISPGIESETYCRSIYYVIARYIGVHEGHRLVFQFNYYQHFPLATLLKARYPDSRIIITVHYFKWCLELKGSLNRLRNITTNTHKLADETERCILTSFANEKTFLHLADETVVLSRKTKGIMEIEYEVSKDKIHLIPNGVGNDICNHDYTCGNNHSRKRNILFVGRMDEIKGLKYLISAFERLVYKYADINLIIVGDGDFQPYLKQCRRMHGRVEFLGKMGNEELEEVYETAYMGVMPSFHEQCSFTAIEMMRYCIPIIGTDSTGLEEMFDFTPQLRVHINEEQFDENKFVEDISFRMDLLLSNSTEYHNASAKVGELYRKRYTFSIMANKTQQMVSSSFARKNHTISPDYLKYLDTHMIRLIDKRPDIDTEFFGISGIGVYLWWRTKSLDDVMEEEYLRTLLLEYLIYYLDWLFDANLTSKLPNEMVSALMDMYKNGFYITRVREIIDSCRSENNFRNGTMPSTKTILSNALRICNCKL